MLCYSNATAWHIIYFSNVKFKTAFTANLCCRSSYYGQRKPRRQLTSRKCRHAHSCAQYSILIILSIMKKWKPNTNLAVRRVSFRRQPLWNTCKGASPASLLWGPEGLPLRHLWYMAFSSLRQTSWLSRSAPGSPASYWKAEQIFP